MKDIPIIFSAPMVRALLDGRKSMTRRLAWRFKEVPHDDGDGLLKLPSPWQKVKPGDRLYVRESLHRDKMVNFLTGERTANADVAYFTADDTGCCNPDGFNLSWIWRGKSLPSIHMPKYFSRLTLVVTAVKVERLNAISCADAIAEGIPAGANSQTIDCATPDPRDGFRDLWNSLHGTDAWEANPEVVAISFVVHKANIDALIKEAA